MRRMGLEALYRRPRTTTPEPGYKIHPYFLRGIEITRPNQVEDQSFCAEGRDQPPLGPPGGVPRGRRKPHKDNPARSRPGGGLDAACNGS